MAQLNGLTRRVVQLRQRYRATLNADFDPRLFWDDAFYASQVLERAARGPRELTALARPLEEMLALSLESRRATGGRMFADGAWPVVHALLRPPVPAPAAHAPERRRAADPGLARLSERDVLLIARLRLQFRRHYGVFFDLLEFTRDDLYARTLLNLCARSSDLVLRSIARRFYDADGAPRLHRRRVQAEARAVAQIVAPTEAPTEAQAEAPAEAQAVAQTEAQAQTEGAPIAAAPGPAHPARTRAAP